MKCNTITTVGQNYLAKCISNNVPIKINNIKIGSGSIETLEEARALDDIKSTKKILGVQSTSKENEIVTISTPLDNIGVDAGFNIREIGIYVLDDGVEKLFWYINHHDECSYLQPHDLGLIRVELNFRLILGSGNMVVENVSNTKLFTTKDYVDGEIKTLDDEKYDDIIIVENTLNFMANGEVKKVVELPNTGADIGPEEHQAYSGAAGIRLENSKFDDVVLDGSKVIFLANDEIKKAVIIQGGGGGGGSTLITVNKVNNPLLVGFGSKVLLVYNFKSIDPV
ncbi:MAG: hypothetical protein ACRCX2_18040, partial [Paraclostridium sp.]